MQRGNEYLWFLLRVYASLLHYSVTQPCILCTERERERERERETETSEGIVIILEELDIVLKELIK